MSSPPDGGGTSPECWGPDLFAGYNFPREQIGGSSSSSFRPPERTSSADAETDRALVHGATSANLLSRSVLPHATEGEQQHDHQPPFLFMPSEQQPQPFLFGQFAETVSDSKLREFGLIGWIQSSLDESILQSTSIRSREKVEQLFGMKFDYSQFPKVVVSHTNPKTPDGSGPSRAAKAGIVEGDQLIIAAGSRITSLATWKGSSPDGALLEQANAKVGKKEKCSFIFYRKKYVGEYVQLHYSGSSGLPVGIESDGEKNALSADPPPGSWAAKVGLKAGDMVLIAGNDSIVRHPERLAGYCSGNSSCDFFIRRSGGFDSATTSHQPDLGRKLPSAWGVAMASTTAASA
ncbi:unnamed protein product, partial [Amoebophrya sp. A120]|eukprot:GSA120T00017629001.1